MNEFFYSQDELEKLAKEFSTKPQEGFSCGIKPFDDIIRMDKQSLTVCVATPGSGKSTFLNYYSSLMAKRHDWKTQFIEFEGNIGRITSDMLRYYGSYMDFNKYSLITKTDNLKSLKDLYQSIQQAKGAFNIDMVIIDTFTNLYPFIGEVNTYSIGSVLTQFTKLAKDLDLNIIVTAHTTKLNKDDDINAYSICGSSNFYNLADFIFSIKIADYNKNLSELKALKIRDNIDKGKVNHYCYLKYNHETKVFTETNEKPTEPNDEPFEKAALNESATQTDKAETHETQTSVSCDEDRNKSTVSSENKQDDKLPTEGNKTQQDAIKRVNKDILKNTMVQVYESYNKSSVPFKEMSLSDFLNQGEKEPYSEIIKELRTVDKEKDKERYDKLKAKLICATPSIISDKKRNIVKSYNHLIVLDIDGVGKEGNLNWNIGSLKAKVNSLPYVLYSSLSCGGNGLFVIVPIDDNGTEDDFKAHFRALYKKFKEMDINLDSQCSDPTRLRVLSQDNKPYINLNATVYTERLIIQERHIASTKSAVNVDYKLSEKDKETFLKAIKDIEEKHLILTTEHSSDTTKGNKRNTIYLGSVLYSLLGEDGRQFLHICRSQRKGYSKQKTNETFNNCADYVERNNRHYKISAFTDLYHLALKDYHRQQEEENQKACYITVPKEYQIRK